MDIYLSLFAFILILIIGCIVYLILNNKNIDKIPEIKTIKKTLVKLSETTPIVNNKIIIVKSEDKLQNTLKLLKYKHEKFLKNLDNSIEFCIDSNKFLLADYITQYRKLYIELYILQKNNKDIDLHKNEEFLLKSIKLDNLNNIIQKQN
jgi:hypothetical protein